MSLLHVQLSRVDAEKCYLLYMEKDLVASNKANFLPVSM